MRSDVSLSQIRESLVPQRAMQHRKVVAQRRQQPCTIRHQIESEPTRRLASLGKKQTGGDIFGQHRLLETLLNILKLADDIHAASLCSTSARCAVSLTASSSTINSGKGGMLSSRSIIVGTVPSCRTVWA